MLDTSGSAIRVRQGSGKVITYLESTLVSAIMVRDVIIIYIFSYLDLGFPT